MSLQRFFTRSTFGRFALFMMTGLLCASLSARPLLAAPDREELWRAVFGPAARAFIQNCYFKCQKKNTYPV